MTRRFRILGQTEEERLASEEANGVPTEAARLIVEESVRQAQEIITQQTREVQEVIGPHGSINRLQAGGVRVNRMGVAVYEDGVLKTMIEHDGDLLVGSDITQPHTTTLCAFVNEQLYNNEQMGAGDLLIGDNTAGASNVKFDASEGQLQFRYGTTVNVYMDTDGTLRAGGGDVTIDANGIWVENQQAAIGFKDTSGQIGHLYMFSDGFDTVGIINTLVGKAILFAIKLTDLSNPYIQWDEMPTETNTALLEINAGTTPTVVMIGNDIILRANKDGTATVFNERSNDIDFRIEGANVNNVFKVDAGFDRVEFGADHFIPNRNSSNKTTIFNEANQDMDWKVEGQTDGSLLFVDASTDRVGIGTATPSQKLHVAGNIHTLGGEFNFPFATYIDLNPITATGKFPYGGTIEASMSFVKFTVSIYTATSHSGSAYYTLTLKARQGAPGADVTILTLDTKTIVGGQQNILSTTSFTNGSITGTGYLYLEVTKTSTPADIYILCPSLRCNLT